ncbi:hypothetical protein [Enterococcus dispar]|uniref:hypothetical protein n=1 Tax=Enterococcus dispar TaxID=44009 RepID=UPI002890399E|nr:hypothetical protein [Enterococcus dispar]MDT2706416.1 hypothetical protein [Enterococcus dispar]
MDAITKIIEQIDEAALAKRTTFDAEQRAQIEEDFLKQKQKLEAEDQKLQAQLAKNQKVKYKQLHARQQMEVKQDTLLAKQSYLSKVFSEAYAKMQAWDTNEAQSFAARCLELLPFEEGKKVFFQPAKQMPTEIYTSEWLAKLNGKLRYKLLYGNPIATESYGFVVDDKGVQYNFLYRDLLNEIKTTDSNSISKMLFEV